MSVAGLAGACVAPTSAEQGGEGCEGPRVCPAAATCWCSGSEAEQGAAMRLSGAEPQGLMNTATAK